MSAAAAPAPPRALLLGAALLAALAGATSLGNGFAFDDRWIIELNPRLHALDGWWRVFTRSYWPNSSQSLYRPLTSLGFLLQWVAGGGAPWVFHAVNVALAAACAAVAARLAWTLRPAVAFAAPVAVLFAVHPVHVEAVANVVGQAELTAALCVLLAVDRYLRARRHGRLGARDLLTVAALYAVGILCKEHAIVLPGVLVAAEWTVAPPAPWRERVAALRPVIIATTLVAVLALLLRWEVIGALGGDSPHPALQGRTTVERWRMMLGVVPDAARLLVWPAALKADYSPLDVVVLPHADPSQLPGAAIIVGAAVLVGWAWRRAPIAAFGAALAALALLPTSNLLFPSGILLSERTLYLPSLGLLLAVAALAWDRLLAPAAPRRAVVAGVAVLAALGLWRSTTRNPVWASNAAVFGALVRDAPLSFKAQHAWGGQLFEQGDLAGGERAWREAIRLYPSYYRVYEDLAHKYRDRGLWAAAVPLYERALALRPGLPNARAGLTLCHLELHQFRKARAQALLGIADGIDPRWFRERLRIADSALTATDPAAR